MMDLKYIYIYIYVFYLFFKFCGGGAACDLQWVDRLTRKLILEART